MSSPLLEHDYIGLSEPSFETTAAAITMAEKSDQKQSSSPPTDLNMKATELRLGPPGSESPERDALPPEENDGKGADYPLGSLNNFVSGAKRGFLDAIDVKSGRWASSGDGGGVGGGSNKSVPGLKDVGVGSSMASEKKPQNHNSSAASVHASKAQVVGWPPIRSFRKNSMNPPPPPKPRHKAVEAGCLYVKVSMDGAPYLRKVDLNTYGSYAQLSAALNNMFSCFSIGENGLMRDHQSSDKCILTYEDKDGDWMLVGDVPWDMFINTCRKLRITISTEPIGSAARALQKCNADAE